MGGPPCTAGEPQTGGRQNAPAAAPQAGHRQQNQQAQQGEPLTDAVDAVAELNRLATPRIAHPCTVAHEHRVFNDGAAAHIRGRAQHRVADLAAHQDCGSAGGWSCGGG
jgi:hypothetical protein